jgi:hypothetical protein
LGEIQFEKNGGKTKWKGGKVFIEPLCGVEIFQGSMENPLRVLGTERVVSRPLKSIVKDFWQGLPKPLKCMKGLFEWGVKKG